MATRHGPTDTDARERFLQAALAVLMDRGVAGLSVRSVAEAAGASTIGVYTRFGGRNGVLDALYERTFELLHDEFAAVPADSGDGIEDVVRIADAYRCFALRSPARFAFMFERSVPGFDPDPELRARGRRTTFDVFAERVRPVSPPGTDHVMLSYLLWTTMHGLVSVELTQKARTPPPGWFIERTDEANTRMYLAGVRAMITGLGLACHE